MVDMCQIDTRGLFGGMPHACTDGREGETFVASHGGPGVACHVEGKRETEAELQAQLAHALVQAALDIPVAIVAVVLAEHGQQIIGIHVTVLVQQRLQGGFYPYLKLLARLAATVHKHIAMNVSFLQVAHIDE